MQIRMVKIYDTWSLTNLYMSLKEEERVLFHPFPFKYPLVFLIFLYFAFSNFLYRYLDLINRFSVISLVAEHEGSIKGFVFISNIKERKVAKNFGILVGRHWQGRGIGRNLADAMIDICKKEGIDEVHLTVMAKNESAISFYKKLGFEVTEYHEKREKWGGKFYPDYSMVFWG